ncbi:16S rRNA (guanine(527)-N(7))-methyltransferase RsmG [Polaromonas sp.]|uniref:16S rRNA (guanine(527)-N(7))-methyltransferase RsmG n=1 Tax=Polaromonas sp. TaxID=1869339 RepID=UPI00286BD5F0|nr:16S rRNA (guanine(527)-N(7))-methyltransferase RsmG [Polaromonas sp.]
MAGAEKDLRAGLLTGLKALGLELSERQLVQLLDYQALIAKWTQVYNLTAVRGPAEMMTHHLLDSLAAVLPLRRHLQQAGLEQGAKLLDVGSGAGLPGVVLAICCPTLAVTCVDTVAKKVAFIRQAALALKLPNLAGLHARVESMEQPFDVICSRAFASLADFTQWSASALAPHGVWMAMKGKHPADELAALPSALEVFHVEQLQVPGLAAERCILWIRVQKDPKEALAAL